jgi:hypothetical protein
MEGWTDRGTKNVIPLPREEQARGERATEKHRLFFPAVNRVVARYLPRQSVISIAPDGKGARDELQTSTSTEETNQLGSRNSLYDPDDFFRWTCSSSVHTYIYL